MLRFTPTTLHRTPRWLGAILLQLAAVALLAGTAQAVPVYGTSAQGEPTGFRSVSSGLLGFNDWQNDFQVDWDISQNGNVWSYEYTFTGLDGSGQVRNISHTVFDLSDDCTDSNCIFNADIPEGEEIEFGDKDGIIGAIKFDFGGGEGFTYSFDSNRAPVYGHLAVKDGGGSDTCADLPNPGSNVVCNVGMSLSSGDPGEMDIINYIARPNGVVPEPGTSTLLAVGLLGAALTRRGLR